MSNPSLSIRTGLRRFNRSFHSTASHRRNGPTIAYNLYSPYLDFLTPSLRTSPAKPSLKRTFSVPRCRPSTSSQDASTIKSNIGPRLSVRTFSTTPRRLRTAGQNASSDASSMPPPPPPAPQPARAVSGPGVSSSASMTITPRAAHRLAQIAEKEGNSSSALRITIESGGCHGFQYLMSLTTLGAENNSAADSEVDTENDDTVFEGPKGAKVVMDESSLELLNGSTVDYTMELIGSQFKVTGIPGASSSCGCGTSFDIKE